MSDEFSLRSELTAGELVDRGCDAMDEGRLDEAVSCFQGAVDMGELWAALNLGNALVEKRQWLAAVRAFEKAIEAGELSARVNLANVLGIQLFRVDEARAEYELAWSEGDTGATVGLASLAESAGDLEAAEMWLERARENGVPGVMWRLGSLLAKAGRVTEGMSLWEEALAAGENEALISRALFRRDNGQIDEARRDLVRAREIGMVEATRYLADLAWREGDEDEARELFEEAVLDDREAFLDFGAFLEETARDPLAPVAVYEQAIASGDLRAHYNEAVLFASLLRWSDAQQSYAQAHEAGDPKARSSFEEWRVVIAADR